MSTKLHELPDEWREYASIEPGSQYSRGRGDGVADCADELENAIPKPGTADAIKMAVWLVCGELPSFVPESIAFKSYWATDGMLRGDKTRDAARRALLDVLGELLPEGDK